MSTVETDKLRRELLLEQAVARRQDRLVRLATEVVLTLPGMRQSKLEESQLRNLAAVARDTASVEVIANFIRYQIARAPNNWGTGANEFGHTIIKQLYTEIRAEAKAVAAEVVRELHKIATDHPEQASAAAAEVAGALDQTDADLHADALIALIRQYIGYLNRAFYFYNKANDKTAAVAQLKQVL